MSRRTSKAARRAELSGTGPARTQHDPGRMPGAASAFALFGEVMTMGLLVSALALPIITLPLAFAVGARHMRRFVRAETTTASDVWSDLKGAALGGLGVGAAMVAIGAVLAIDLALAATGALPGSGAIAVVGWVGLAALALAVLSAAAAWTPEGGWRAGIRSSPRVWRDDPVGVLYLLAAVALVVIVTWQFFPLVVPGIGCLVLAMIAIPERPRSGRATEA